VILAYNWRSMVCSMGKEHGQNRGPIMSPKTKSKYSEFLRKYKDDFAWSYEELRTYDTTVIEHKIPLKPGVKTFRQKLRQINPILLHVVEREVKNLLNAKIIVPLR